MKRCSPNVLVSMAVLVVACAPFLPALSGEFLNWDDVAFIVDNPNWQGLSGKHLAWMFTTFDAGHYQPLSWLSLAIDRAFWGMEPVGYHATSILLHGVTAVLLYFVILELLEPSEPGARVAAMFGALLFAVHPLRVESVAWITERRDVLSAALLLASFLAYLRGVRGGSTGPMHVLACLFLGLSLLAKAWGMTFAALLLALDLFVLKRSYTRALLVEKVPFLVLGLMAAVVAMLAQGSAGAVLDLEEHGALDRLLQAGYGLAFYVVKTIAPFGLSPLYLREELRAPSGVPLYWIALAASLLMTGLAVATRRRHPWFLAAWACYVIIASPVLGLLQSGAQAVADRYTYVACMPWVVLAAAGIWRVLRGSWPHRRAHAYVLVGATSLVVLGLVILTVEQSAHWRTTLALWDHAVRVDPANYVARTNRANALLAGAPDAARPERGRALLTAAVSDFSESIALAPGYGYAYASRGLARMALGQYREAANDFTAAIDLVGRDPDVILQRGLAYAAQGQRQVALADFEEVLRLNPTSTTARANRDMLLTQAGTPR